MPNKSEIAYPKSEIGEGSARSLTWLMDKPQRSGIPSNSGEENKPNDFSRLVRPFLIKSESKMQNQLLAFSGFDHPQTGSPLHVVNPGFIKNAPLANTNGAINHSEKTNRQY
jgi:hypothetical protein